MHNIDIPTISQHKSYVATVIKRTWTTVYEIHSPRFPSKLVAREWAKQTAKANRTRKWKVTKSNLPPEVE